MMAESAVADSDASATVIRIANLQTEAQPVAVAAAVGLTVVSEEEVQQMEVAMEL
jgi:hypothetical protein